MGNQTKSRLYKAISKLLVFVMIIGIMAPVGSVSVSAADLITKGDWTYTNTGTNDEATFGSIGFTYHSPTTGITAGSSGGKDYVKSTNCNGKNSNGIVVTSNQSYADFKAPYDGVLTVYVGKAANKIAYVSTATEAIGHFEPCGLDGVNQDGLVVTQGTTWATVEIDVKKDVTYYITVQGSKMVCYGAEFAPNTIVSGTITDSYNVGSYGIKLTNSVTGKSYTAAISGNTYTATVKPGNYTITLTGENALKYAITTETNKVTAAASTTMTPNTVTADIVIGENSAAMVSGKLTGFADGYDISDLKLKFVPADTATYENVEVEITDKTYEAILVT